MKHICFVLVTIFVFQSSPSVCQAQSVQIQLGSSRCSQAPKPRTKIRFEISLVNTDEFPAEGEEIYLRLIFKNVSKTNQRFLLDDHSEDYGTQEYPYYLFAKIWDATGKVVTDSENRCDGWTVSDCYGGRVELVRREPGDIITLRPNEQITRIVPLNSMLAKCFASPASEDLRAGKNTAQLRLENIYSNKLEIEVKPKAK